MDTPSTVSSCMSKTNTFSYLIISTPLTLDFFAQNSRSSQLRLLPSSVRCSRRGQGGFLFVRLLKNDICEGLFPEKYVSVTQDYPQAWPWAVFIGSVFYCKCELFLLGLLSPREMVPMKTKSELRELTLLISTLVLESHISLGITYHFSHFKQHNVTAFWAVFKLYGNALPHRLSVLVTYRERMLTHKVTRSPVWAQLDAHSLPCHFLSPLHYHFLRKRF